MRLAAAGSQVLLWRTAQKGAGVLAALAVMQGLGPEGNGRYSLSVAAITVLSALLSGGVGLASVPRLRDPAWSPRRILSAQATWVGLVVVALGLVGVALRFGPFWIWCASSLGWDDGLLVAILAAAVAMIVFETANYDLLAAGSVVVGAFLAASRAVLLLLVLGLLVLVAGQDVGAALAAFAGAHALAALVLAPRAWRAIRHLPDQAVDPQPSPGAMVGRLLRHGWLGQLSSLIYLLLLRLDQFLIEGYLDVAAVGLYAAAAWATELLWLVPEAINPLVVHTASSRQDTDRDRITARAVRLGLGLTALAAVPLGLLCEPLLGLLRDGAFAPAAAPLRALLPGAVAFAPGIILAGDFIGRGRPQWNTQASAATVAINVLLCLWWLPTLGLVGAAWASTVAYAAGSLMMVVRFKHLSGLGWATILLPRPSDLRF